MKLARLAVGMMLLLVAACGFHSNAAPADAAIDTPDAPPDAPMGGPTLLPEVHDYGTLLVAGSTPSVTFMVTSLSPTPQLGTAITGINAGDFEITADTCNGVALPTLSSCTIAVRFAPVVATGMKSASLVVVGAGGIDLIAMLRGRYDIPPDYTVTPSSIPFGTVHVGQVTAAVPITLFNGGTLPTTTLTITKTGSEAAEFTIVSDPCNGTALAPMTSCVIQVAFAPNGVGAKSAMITANATIGGPRMVLLSGTGQALTIATTPADFGSIVVGVPSAPQTLTVTNVAASSVGPLVTSLAGNHPGDFALGTDTCTGATLPPAGTCTIDVRFVPTTLGARNGLVRLVVGSTIIADGIVQGIGEPPDPISISPTSYAFTGTTAGQTSTAQGFTLFNTGTTATGILASSLGGTDPTQFSIVTATDTCTGNAVPAGGMCTIEVVFAPTTTGAKTASLSLTSTPGGTHTATLSGTGL